MNRSHHHLGAVLITAFFLGEAAHADYGYKAHSRFHQEDLRDFLSETHAGRAISSHPTAHSESIGGLAEDFLRLTHQLRQNAQEEEAVADEGLKAVGAALKEKMTTGSITGVTFDKIAHFFKRLIAWF